MYLAAARMKLGQSLVAAHEWDRAMQDAAGKADLLVTLGSYAETEGAFDVAARAFAAALAVEPENRAASNGACRIAETIGKTEEAERIVSRMQKIWPDDVGLKAEGAYLRLLTRHRGADLNQLRANLELLVLQQPSSWKARSALALAFLELKEAKKALDVFHDISPAEADPASAIAIHALALAGNGRRDEAKSEAQIAAPRLFLPEERALIAPLLPP